jgi:hypothetical protein
MRREGTDPDNVAMEDVLCDFCRRSWTLELPFVEGHHGSCVCGECLATAYRRVILAAGDDRIAGYRCTMCLEDRPDAAFRSPSHPDAFICLRCIKLGAASLARDPDAGWRRPAEA